MATRKRTEAEHLLELLWRTPAATPSRGPRPGLTVDKLIRTAIALADREGLQQLTIRRVATKLKVAPMSVYTYVPGKSALIMLMLDAVFADMQRSAPSADSWRARIQAVADDNHRLYSEHPWIAELPPNRPPLGPGTLDKYEYELAALEGVGLSDIEIDSALQLVLGFVGACAATSARARAEISESAQTDAEWWTDHEPALLRVMGDIGTRYPLGSRIGAASAEVQQGTYDAEHHYRFGLARVLDGLAALIEK
jgi:AcrR family transcriptional regulator